MAESDYNKQEVKELHFRGQDYKKLKKELQAAGQLFEDPEFPPCPESISPDAETLENDFEWKRPSEISDNPKLVVGGVSKDDMLQGAIGNCWFIAACSTLTHYKELWKRVLPDLKEQEWNDVKPELYCGIFKFKFWRFGYWTEVVVDDRLPTRNGKLVFAHSKQDNEFWGPLFEKAFAKLFRTYSVLIGGSLADALVDITGGVPEKMEVAEYTKNDKEDQLYDAVFDAYKNKALMAAAVNTEDSQLEAELACGLICGHAYAVTDAKRFTFKSQDNAFVALFKKPGKIMMIRLRNPWGKKEWNGPWSTGSPEWDKIGEKERNKLGLTIEEDGEFWMSFEDFCDYFTDVSICHMINTNFISFKTAYYSYQFAGCWDAANNRAGGCSNHKGTYFNNPQYRFNMKDNVSKTAVMISLMQADVRKFRDEGAKLNSIGFDVQKVEDNRNHRMKLDCRTAASASFSPSRFTFLRTYGLKKGRYIIVPSTFDPGYNGDFLIRLFTHRPATARVIKRENIRTPFWACLCLKPKAITRVIVESAQLEPQNILNKQADAFCIVRGGGRKATSAVVTGTLSPEWNTGIVFVRWCFKKPIIVKVYNRQCGCGKKFIGWTKIDCPKPNGPESKRTACGITDKKNNQVGQVTVQLDSFKGFVDI